MTVLERFVDKITFTDKCWLWENSLTPEGYGLFGLHGKNVHAHRVSYRNFVGPIGRNMHVHHTCEVTNCVNPDHLLSLTPSEHRRIHLGWYVRCGVWYCPEGHVARVTKKGNCQDCKNEWNRLNRPSRAKG